MSGLLARLRARIPLEEGSLVLITMIWGATFIIIRSALEATGPFFFVGVRFAFAALALILFSLPLLKDFTWREVWAGMSIGLCIFGGYALQTCGLQTITASKSAFITAFYVPLVPLLQWLVMKRPPHLMAWVGIALAFPGVLLLSGPDDSSAGFGWGEMLTAISALAIAMEIILIGLVARSVNARRVTIVQVLMASLLSFATMPLVGESVPPPSWLVLGSAFALGVSTAGIQYAINWAQKKVSPTRATLIYSCEPVWAGIFGRMAGERLPGLALLGGAMILAGVLVSELKPGGRKKGKDAASLIMLQ